MTLDTRPALTARWRALERKGWKFRIAITATENIDSMVEVEKTLQGSFPHFHIYRFDTIHVPMLEARELRLLKEYEQRTP